MQSVIPSSSSNNINQMYVINRHGEKEAVYFERIYDRIEELAKGLHPLVDPINVAKSTINGMYPGIPTSELDELAAQTCAYLASAHPDYSKLAARIAVSNLHKSTTGDFGLTVHRLYYYADDQTQRSLKLISDKIYVFVMKCSADLNDMLDYKRDFEFDYFAFKTLEKSYLLRMNGRVVERPQHMFMRLAVGIHAIDATTASDADLSASLENIKRTYDLVSKKFFTHATPTLFNAGTPRPQMSSCFLLQMKDDSISGIYDTLKNCALISKSAGGIGVSIHKIRASGTYISGTNGVSNGIVPMLRVFNDTARYVDQGGGKRKGSFAIYLEPWHADIFDFLDLKKNHGKEESRARDLFYGLWIPDLFMRRVTEDGIWSLMCPHQCPGLNECYGKEFDKLYTKYEEEKCYIRQVNARLLWFTVLQSQIETGTPYLCYKDAANRKTNQQNVGVIQSSNLCTEIMEYTSPDEVAVCNLGSVSLPAFVEEKPDTASITDRKSGEPLSDVDHYSGRAGNYVDDAPSSVNDDASEGTDSNKENSIPARIDVNGNPLGAKRRRILKRGKGNMGSDSHPVTPDVAPCPTECKDTDTFRDLDMIPDEINVQIDKYCTEWTTPDAIVAGDVVYQPPQRRYNFYKLYRVVKVLAANLNRVIDENYYPVTEGYKSNMRHRPIGIGIQGLADAFLKLRFGFESAEAAQLNTEIFETIYFAALETSCELAMTEGAYETYKGSPIDNGKLQFDMWNDEFRDYGIGREVSVTDRWDWEGLRDKIKKYGVRNSLLLAPMPTASTAQILGNCESFEPYTSNVYSRRVLAGEFAVVNPHLLDDLIKLGVWNETLRQKMIAFNGSVQLIDEIPAVIKPLYKTVWEIKQKHLIDLAAGRAGFICQSQSLNLYMTGPSIAKLTSMHFYAWKTGLKTGIYYLRTTSPTDAIKFTVDANVVKAANEAKKNVGKEEEVVEQQQPIKACPLRRKGAPVDEDCLMCSG